MLKRYIKLKEWIRWVLFLLILFSCNMIAIFVSEIVSVISEGSLDILSAALAIPVRSMLWLTAIFYFIPRWNIRIEKITFWILIVTSICALFSSMFDCSILRSYAYEDEDLSTMLGSIIAVPGVIIVHFILKLNRPDKAKGNIKVGPASNIR